MKQKGIFRIICLGESTTQNQYPVYLEEILNQRDIGVKFSVIDKGMGGTNTVVILSQLEANLGKYQPDIVVTMMGINDWGKHMPYERASDSKTILFLRSFKVYKLASLLWLHTVTRLREAGFSLSVGNNQISERMHQDTPKDKFKETDKQDSFQRKQALKKALELNSKDDSAYAGFNNMLFLQYSRAFLISPLS